MSESRGSIHAITLGTITLCIIASVIGASAKQDKTGTATLKVATFDVFRLRTESKFALDTEKRLFQKQEETNLMLNTWKNNSYLLPADQKRLGDLAVEEKIAKANFTPEKVAEKKKLEDQSRLYGEEVSRLSASQNLTSAEADRIKQLGRAQGDTQARIDDELRKQQALFQKDSTDATNVMIKNMRDSVAKVAKEKGIALVLSNEIAWYADTDLTDAALAAMNGKK